MSKFEHEDLIPLKRMIEHSRPERLHEVSQHWTNVQKELEQAITDLQRAVQHATANWEGAAADGFTKRATLLQSSMTNTAAHAQNTSAAMKYAGQALQQAKETMAQIKVPSTFDRGVKLVGDGFDRSDAQFKADLAGGMDRISAVNKNYGELSATEISHQYAIGVMEHLAPQYTQAAGYLKTPMKNDRHEPPTEYPPQPENPVPPNTVCPPPVPPKYPNGVPDDRSDKPGQVDPQGPKQQIPHTPAIPTPLPGDRPPGSTPGIPTGPVNPPSTNIDSLPPVGTHPTPGGGGTGTLPTSPGGGGGLGGGNLGGGGGIGGGGMIPGGLGGGALPGRGGTAGGAGRGGATGPGGRTGGGAGGAGTGGGTGRPGMPGMGGMPGAGAAGAGGKGAGGKGGSGLVRRGGGVIGGAKGGTGGRAFTEGGSGIGKGRAGQGGAPGGGFHGGNAATGKKKDKNNGQRPDYLVEDEETWRGGSANPPVID
ncbi:WXG100 family type VII secretion target [Kitasatospora sp. NPDC051914]|uniref:WXG100 family type VII secretion target n=1 Tax=Kitasatospora sp. NPDC051914 TaxID=3154945 RepID=UPI003444953C